MAKAGVAHRTVAAIGDSTFFHSGMSALANVAYNGGRTTPASNVITLIADNRTTAMTGHQDNPGTGKTLQGKDTVEIEFEPLVRALGIEEVYTVDPYDLASVERVLRHCLEVDKPAVIISRRECALLPQASDRFDPRKEWKPLRVNARRCNGCGLCFRVGCPAVIASEEIDERTHRRKARLDPLLCTGCEICAQVCARKAILTRAQLEGGNE